MARVQTCCGGAIRGEVAVQMLAQCPRRARSRHRERSNLRINDRMLSDVAAISPHSASKQESTAKLLVQRAQVHCGLGRQL